MNAIRRFLMFVKIRNEELKRQINLQEDILDKNEKKQLIYYGHAQRMNTVGLPKQALEWAPPERIKQRRPKTR